MHHYRYQPSIYRQAGEALQVAQRRQKGGGSIIREAQRLPWSPNGGTAVATVIVQCTLLVAQRKHTGGRNIAQVDEKHCPGWRESLRRLTRNIAQVNENHCAGWRETLHQNAHITWRHLATSGRPLCLPSGSFGQTTSSDTFGDCFEPYLKSYGDQPMATCEPPVYHLWPTRQHSASFDLNLARRPGTFYGRTREVQRSPLSSY